MINAQVFFFLMIFTYRNARFMTEYKTCTIEYKTCINSLLIFDYFSSNFDPFNKINSS